MFQPNGVEDWRAWLEQNHIIKDSVWLIYKRKKTGIKSITWSESVDVALCYGWIDSKHVKIDDATSKQFFCKRKAKSTWSKVNKLKIEKLISEGLMREAGLKSIEIAKQNGSWTILDEVENYIIPLDLKEAFNENYKAFEFFESISKSSRKAILQWLVMAKRKETRDKRIKEIVEMAIIGKKPKHIP